MCTYTSVGVASVAFLTGTGVVAREVATQGVGSTGVGFATLINVCK